jgi:hypothetical protein
VALNAAAGDGKKTDEGIMMPPPGHKPNSMASADPRETRSHTPATAKMAFDILTNCKDEF